MQSVLSMTRNCFKRRGPIIGIGADCYSVALHGVMGSSPILSAKIECMNIEYLETLPFRESRKEYLTRKYNNMCDINKFDHPWTRSIYMKSPYYIAGAIANHYVGKTFDEAFSKYCMLVKSHEQHIFFREFKREDRNFADFYLKDGIICKSPESRTKYPTIFTSIDFSCIGEGYNNWYKVYLHVKHPDKYPITVISGFYKVFSGKQDYRYQRLQQAKTRKLKQLNKLSKQNKIIAAEKVLRTHDEAV